MKSAGESLTISELLDVRGLGPEKIQSYGRAILSLLKTRVN